MGFVVFLRERTDPGLVRKQNEDSHGYFQPPDRSVREAKGELYIVADGMGGYAAGELASHWAVQQIIYAYYQDQDPDPAACLRRAIEEANYGIYANATADHSREGMGSTVVATVVWGKLLVVGHVGDSRAYLVRAGQITRLTQDHSWVAEALAKGLITAEQAANHPNRNVVTRSLGGKPTVQVDISNYTLQAGDIIVLCSDGLHGVVGDEEIAQVASAYAEPSQIPDKLIGMANERGGPDNITVTALRLYDDAGPLPRRLSDTQPVTPALPPALEQVESLRETPPPGGIPALFRRYPVISAVGAALLGVILILAVILLLLTRGGGGGGNGTPTAGGGTPTTKGVVLPPGGTVTATTPLLTIPTRTVPSSVLTATATPISTSTLLPTPSAVPTGYMAYVAPDGFLHVVTVGQTTKSWPYLVKATDQALDVLAVYHPSWSPDGQWLAYQVGEGPDSQVWIVSWLGGELGQPQPLTDGPGGPAMNGLDPTWSPDGQWLAYIYNNAVWRCRLQLPEQAGTGGACLEATQVAPSCSETAVRLCEDRYPTWMPQGKRIAFTRIEDDDKSGRIDIWSGADKGEIWLASVDQKKLEPMTKSPGEWDAFPAAWPGEELIWSSGQPFNVRIEETGIITRTGVEPAWGPGGWIVYIFQPDPTPAGWELRFVRANGQVRLCADGSEAANGCSAPWPGQQPAWWWPGVPKP